MEEIFKELLRLNNFKDITEFAEGVVEAHKKNNTKPKLAQAFEAMNLYNMYILHI